MPAAGDHASWDDANAYMEWLSKTTGEAYRLTSEAEWEYVARAGTTASYWWRDVAGEKLANYGGAIAKTTEVGAYPPSPWGLFDTSGNVWEWVEDCRHDSYNGAPSDGSAWISSCPGPERVMRGGSWLDRPGNVRSAVRGGERARQPECHSGLSGVQDADPLRLYLPTF